MLKNQTLIPYWFTFPDQPNGPMGMGVTAFSIEDAHLLMEKSCYRFHKNGETKIKVISSTQELDQSNVLPNMGPITFRGIWYPCLNLGIGASGQ
jgi:hypothetical protein